MVTIVTSLWLQKECVYGSNSNEFMVQKEMSYGFGSNVFMFPGVMG